MQADQTTVISLRPGGVVIQTACDRHVGFLVSVFSDIGLVIGLVNCGLEDHERIRYTRDQLLQHKEVENVPEDILKIRQEIESEFVGEDQTWSPCRWQRKFSVSSFWRGQIPEAIRENKEFYNRQDQLNSQFASAQITANQRVGPAPALIKAEVPCILNKLTPEKFDVLKGQLIDSGITTPIF
ncbi:hypothetical protein NC653_038883 [Populus alba x Populus x berolinensis]|uniref:Uncharacterized protein n=1 Tax=Populus alba x Populus x berolinensis TaxID=444605 RepID=A0AAD6LA01_9ROSI|nr:hypothetical protein NC653_038883 [Populus alba x Populus x berolinensis]